MQAPNVRPAPVVCEMYIRYTADGNLQFRGAPQDPVMFYGIMETLKETYARMRAEAAAASGKKVEAEPERVLSLS